MAENPGSKDRALEALDFIINVIKDHEQNLDKSIHELATVIQQIGETDELNVEIEKFDEKLNFLQKEMTNLIGYLPNSPKEALPDALQKQEPRGSGNSLSFTSRNSKLALHDFALQTVG